MTNIKAVVVGNPGVGKTCFAIKYTTNQFPTYHVSTIDHALRANVGVDGTVVNLGLWDTSHHNGDDSLLPLSYPNTDVFLICYSIASPSSLQSIKDKWVPLIREHRPNTPFILVGTKSDLRTHKLVPFEDAQAMRAEVGAKMVFECSAKESLGMSRVVDTALRAALGKPLLPGYSQKSRQDKSCKRCQRTSRDTCECERARRELHVCINALPTVRQWCRIFSAPERFLDRAPDTEKMLLDFFVERPGLRVQCGGIIVSYFNPITAEPYPKKKEKSSDCCVMM